MKKNYLIVLLIILSYQIKSQNIEMELNKISGKFVGEWTMFKLSDNGEKIKAYSWKDTINTSKAIINDTIAYVTVNDMMLFDDPTIPRYSMKFKEGFILNEKTPEHFIEIKGVRYIETKINENTFVIQQPISKTELLQLGINSAIEAYNTTVKIILNQKNQEIQKITRVTTFSWKDNNEIKSKQFVSMEGYHLKLK